MKSRKSRQMQRNIIVVALIVLFVTGSVSFAWYRLSNHKLIAQREKFEQQLELNEVKLAQYEDQSRTGWLLLTDKKAGETIQESDVQQKKLPDASTPANVIADGKDVIGKVAKINLSAATAITSEMVYADKALGADERQEEVQYVRLPLRIQAGDTVDIRIVFPTGEDYIVVAKKEIEEVDVANQNAFFNDTEEEALLLQAALVDAYLNEAEIYMKQYVEPELQEAPTPTYIPNQDVLMIIKSKPEIIDQARYTVADTLRKALDSRLDALDLEEKVRIGAGAPMGSAVSKRKPSDGQAAYTPSGSADVNATDGTSVGVNGIVDGQTDQSTVYPAPAAEDVPNVNDGATDAAGNMLGGQ